MEVPNHVVCDVCGQSKGETNHWLVAVTHPEYSGITFVPAEEGHEPRNPGGQYQDLCGHGCYAKCFSQRLETLNAERKSYDHGNQNYADAN